MARRRLWGLNAWMLLVVGTVYVVLAVTTVLWVRTSMRNQMLDSAREQASNITRQYLAVHRYFSEELKPSVFPLAESAEGDDYFDARWMSSSHAVAELNAYYTPTHDGVPYYYREAAVGARNPANEADAAEAAYLQRLAAGDTAQLSEVQEFDGEPYYVVMAPGEVFQESCMRCHSTPEAAPADLVATYGPTTGFNKQVGSYASVVSVRVPLAAAYNAVDVTTFSITGELLLVMLISLLGTYYFNERRILHPVREMNRSAAAIASGDLAPGTGIEVKGAREIVELSESFSTMSARVAETIDSLEVRVKQRTETLDAMNQELLAEIAEREGVEARLDSQKRYAESLIETANVLVVGLDTRGNITVFNQQAELVSGWSAERVLGLSFFDILCPAEKFPEARLQWERTHGVAMREGNPLQGHEYRGRIVTMDGRVRTIEWRDSSIVVDGAISGSIAFGVDVTEAESQRRELDRYRTGLEALVEERTRQLEITNEQLRRATDAKSQFLANMSHELRTPLNSIIGFSDLMLQEMAGPVSEEQARQLAMVNDAGRYLLSLVNDVLDLSRVENGAVSVQITEFDVTLLAESVVESLLPVADDRGLEIEFETPHAGVIMRSDEVKVRQILVNIISNAVKFTEAGSVRISCTTADGEVVFSVTDTGPGIPADELNNVFAVFWQHKVGERAKPEGAGLGLSISRRLAHLLGGGITVSSEVGVGSTFTVTLPLEVPEFRPASDDDEVLS